MSKYSKRTAIILSGGGMRCSYTGGFLCGFAERFASRKPDIMIATSGGAGCLAYYLSDQYDEIYTIWTKELANIGYINPYEIYRLMSMDFALYTVFQKNKPLNTEKLLKTKTNWYITASEIPKNTAMYFSKNDIAQGEDIFDILGASMSVPILYGGTRSIYGKFYIDGGVAAPFSATVEKAIALGATDIIAVDTSRRQNQDILSLHREGISIYLIRNTDIPARLLTHNSKVLEEAFMMGYNDALENYSLDDFFD